MNGSSHQERKAHWDAAWLGKPSAETSWFQAVPERSLQMIRDSGIGKDEPLIDVGGGASKLVDHLLDAGFSDLTVLDISTHALSQARDRLGSRADSVDWVTTDVTEYRSAGRFRLWHDRAVFHFLTDETDRQSYVDTLRRHLLPGAQLIIATFAPEGPMKCSGLEVERYDAEKLGRELGAAFQLREERFESHFTPWRSEQLFGYFRYEKTDL
jgi:SAM-dependent methyltransferase